MFSPAAHAIVSLITSLPLRSTLFPYTTLFRSDLDQSPNTMTINVTSVNDAPVGADTTVSTSEDTAYTFTAANFALTDPRSEEDTSELQSHPPMLWSAGLGTLTDNGVAVSAGQFISVADITAGKLVFTPAANANGSPEASFTFPLQDDGFTCNGAADPDQSPHSLHDALPILNDAPVGADTTVSTSEDTAYTFTAANFALTDP